MNVNMKKFALTGLAAAICSAPVMAEETNLYWGDTHLHTSYSLDAFLSLNYSADPDTAYRWAKGQPVIHPYSRAKIKINTPLDFLVVSDHAEAMGVMRAIGRGEEELTTDGFSILEKIQAWLGIRLVRYKVEDRTGMDLFNSDIIPSHDPDLAQTADPVKSPMNVLPKKALGETTITETKAWSEIVDAAERHNDPGKFTAFLGWVGNGALSQRV